MVRNAPPYCTNPMLEFLFRRMNNFSAFAPFTVCNIDFARRSRYAQRVHGTERVTDELLYAAVGRRIRKVRTDKNITQEDLAGAVGLTRTSVTNIEKGRQKLLLHTLSAIARRLAVPCASLLPDESELNAVVAQTPESIVDQAGTRDDKERQFVLRTLGREKKGR